MTNYVGWDDVDTTARGKKRSSSDGESKFMKLEANQTYTIRPIHRAVMFYKYYSNHNGKFRTAIVEDPSTSSIKDKYPKLRASRRFAMLVFDRDDDNKMKIFEFGTSVFDAFKSYRSITKEEPGGPKGGDFSIYVDCPSGKKDRETRYKVEFVEACDFTEEERALIKAEQEGRAEGKGEYDLQVIFKPHSDEEIEERLFGDVQENSDSDRKNSDKKETVKEESRASVYDKSDDDDDLFNF